MMGKVSLSVAVLAIANAFAASVWDGSVATAFTAGKGTVAEPYQISNGAELALFAQKVSAGDTALNAVLTDDIYLNENSEQFATWNEENSPANKWKMPIGLANHTFRGSFDGKGHKIYGVYIDKELEVNWSGIGLFGTVGDSAIIKNVGVTNSYVSVYGVIDGTNITTNPHVGIIAGAIAGAHVTNVSAHGLVRVNSANATTAVHYSENGCFAGYASKRIIIVNAETDCDIESTFEMTSTGATHHSLGGFIGKVQGNAYIENVYSRSVVKNLSKTTPTAANVGGLIGFLTKATDTLSNAYYNISTIGTDYAPEAAIGNNVGVTKNVASKTTAKMKNEEFSNILGPAFTYTALQNDGYPQLVVFEGASAFDGGNGTEASPYLIGSAKALRAVSGLVNGMNAEYGDKHYKMTTDVELNEDSETYKSWETTPPEFSWFPIGREYHPNTAFNSDCGGADVTACSKNVFSGVFDGSHHSVKGLFINDTTNHSQGGLFYVAKNAVIKNLGVENSFVNVKGRATGLVALASFTKIDSCFNSAEIRSISQDNGGIAAAIFNSEISNSYNKGNIKVTYKNMNAWSTGGIAGEMFRESKIVNCWNSGSITGVQSNVGGVAGGVDSSALLNVYNRGTVSSDSVTGGVVGLLRFSSTMTSAYNTGAVSSKIAAKRGGVIGVMQERTSPKVRNIVSDCYYNSQTIGTSNAPTTAIGTTAGTVTNTSALPTATMTTGRFAIMLGTAYKQADDVNDGYPTFLGEGETYGVVDIFAGGDGSEENPFLIATATQLRNMEYLVNKKNAEYGSSHYKLIADIALNDNTENYANWATTAPANTWTPMGSSESVPFKGVFDGDNYTISGIYTNAKYSGLFGYIAAEGIVKNINITQSLAKTTATSGSAGLIAGYSAGLIQNVTNKGNIWGNITANGTSSAYNSIKCGGIVGEVRGVLSNAKNSGDIRCSANGAYQGVLSGGIAGYSPGGLLKNLENSGSITNYVSGNNALVKAIAGGIVGLGEMNGSIDSVLNTGSVYARGKDTAKVAPVYVRVGGIVGQYSPSSTDSAVITRAINTANLEGLLSSGHTTTTSEASMGGIVGKNYGGVVVVRNSLNSGDIKATSSKALLMNHIGGIFGFDQSGIIIENCYASGKYTVASSTNTAPKSSKNYIGGISGVLIAKSSVKGSYFAGTLTSTISGTTTTVNNKGGIVGNNAGSIIGSYFDKTVAGFENVTGANTGTLTKALPLTTEEMKTNEFAWKLNTFGGDATNTGAFTRYNDYPEFGDATHLPIYRVVFDDAVDIYNIYTSYSGFVKAPADPEPAPGDMFVGWTDGDKYMLQNRQIINKDMTLFALFTLLTEPIYSITFIDGSDVLVKVTETNGKLNSLPVAKNIPVGYHFDGWYDNTTETEITTETVFTGAATAIARFSAILYKITFLDYNGSEIASSDVAYGQMPVAPANPSRDPTDEYTFEFIGWDNDIVAVVGEATYTAVYEATAISVNPSSSGSGEDPESSSSSEEPSSSSVKPASSSVEPSSSSVKPASSNSEKPTSSAVAPASSSAVVPSSSQNTDVLPVVPHVPQFTLTTTGRNIHIAGAHRGSAYAVLDMQGRIVMYGRVYSENFNLAVSRAGTYLIRIGSQVQSVSVR